MSKLFEFIKQADFISPKPRLLVNGEKKFQTNFGGMMSCLALTLITSSVIYFLVQLLEKKSVNVSYSQLMTTNPSINVTNFPFAFMLQDKDKNLIKNPEKLFSIEFHNK